MASFESQKLILCLWVFIINFYIEVSQSQWIEADDPFPRISDEMAIGEYNGTIFIFGGWTYSRQLVEYEINTQTLTDRGTSFLPDNRARGGNGQYWTQQGHIVYLLEHPSPNTFDIRSQHNSIYLQLEQYHVGYKCRIQRLFRIITVVFIYYLWIYLWYGVLVKGGKKSKFKHK
eukprot:467089_1